MEISTTKVLTLMEKQLEQLKAAVQADQKNALTEHAAVLKGYCDLFLEGVEKGVSAPRIPASVSVKQPIHGQQIVSKAATPFQTVDSDQRQDEEKGNLLDF
ncbi:YwdI family protein [Halalkalibacterium halodurans]|uniref:YwdI family protein n=1 Tax=Halalkalibacterium halodurans TaxID=86665 RepID=UPI001068038D|nr:YwdI family protein [Halalkalibacterium halodurans]MED3647999.1 YwdI family protein [Halalkalibacterium halodurans]MED4163371.1 YwdI family protein [Halalkalibacterium halodurans]TES57377.1 hypothetical protein E2L07_03000 [Halalkalibacterium halodurans]